MKNIYLLLFSALIVNAGLKAQSNTLILDLPFSKNTEDISGNNYDGIVEGATFTKDRFGIDSSAYFFDGVNDYITIKNATLLNDADKNISISVWYKPVSKNFYNTVIAHGGAKFFIQLINTLKPAFLVQGVKFDYKGATSYYDRLVLENSTSTTSWTHLVTTFDSNNSKIQVYINGKLAYEGKAEGSLKKSNDDWRIGARISNNFPEYFYGAIDDIKIYSNIISSSDVEDLYQETASKTCDANFELIFDSTKSCTITLKNKSKNTSRNTIYTWGFGDGNYAKGEQTNHTYSKNGEYRITLNIQDSSIGCSSVKSQSVNIKACSKPCAASFIWHRDSLDTCYYRLESASETSNTAEFFWSLGDDTYESTKNVKHTYESTGWKEVTFAINDTANSCTASITDSIYVVACVSSNCSNTIKGQITVGSNYAQNCVVYLIEKSGNYIRAVDTTVIDSIGGNYEFNDVCNGDYLIKCALLSNDLNYSNYLPTYYGSSLKWDSATVVSLNSSNYGLDIAMISGQNMGGKGFVSGNVNKGANKKTADPMADIQISILDVDYSPVGYTYSSENGTYELSNLSFGTFYLFVDIPGITSNYIQVVLSETKPSANVDLEINSDDVTTSVSEIKTIGNNGLSIYPNPTSSSINIEASFELRGIEIHDLTGRLLMSNFSISESTQYSVDVSSFNTGIYIIKTTGKNGIENVTQFIKN